MNLEEKIWKFNSYLRGQIPAYRADEIIRKLAFLYYLSRKLALRAGQKSLRDVGEELLSALSDPNALLLTNCDSGDLIAPDYAFEKLETLRAEARKAWEDIRSVLSDVYQDGTDVRAIHSAFSSLTEEELYEVLIVPFDQSFREESTPFSISDIVLMLADGYVGSHERATDMTCGTGSFLLRAAKRYSEVHGVELNSDNASLASVRLILSGITGEIRSGNCFEDSWRHQAHGTKSDLVFAEFPWKMVVKDPWQKEIMLNCNANRFPLSPGSNTDYFFLSAMMNYLKKDGVAITVMPMSSLSNLADKPIREQIVRRGYLREVIALPANIFGRTSVSTAIVVVGLKPVDKVCFFDGSSYFKQEKRKTNVIDVERLLADLAAAKENGSCYFATDVLSSHDYSFSPNVYLSKVESIIPNPTELAEVADIFTGWQVSSAKLEMIHKTDGTGVRLLQMSNVEGGSIAFDLERYDIPASTVEKFAVRRGDVVISTKSLKVKSAVVDLDDGEPIVAAGSIMVIRPKVGELDPYYLAAYFESDMGRQVLEMYQSGNVIPNLSIGNVKKIPIPRLGYRQQSDFGAKYKDFRDLILSEKARLNALERKVNTLLDGLWDTEEDD